MTASNGTFIRPPANPFWEVFKTFGRDELTGGVIALVATAFIEGGFYFYNGEGIFTPLQMLCLAIAGPILEKFGFFFWHFKEAKNIYKTTPVDDRKPYEFYLKKAFRGGLKTLIWDLLLHDPLYILLMLFGMKVHPSTPAWLLVPIAFAIAVVAVTVLEVTFNEIRYFFFRREKRQRGYELESYLDARFYLDSKIDALVVIERLRDQFLPDCEIYTRSYEDHYFTAELPKFNSREGKMRLRRRGKDEGESISIQYIYTRTIEDGRSTVGQFRFFPRKKDKHYRMFSDFDTALVVAKNEAAELGCKDKPQKIEFQRFMAYRSDTIFIAVDSINGDLRVIELKVYHDKPKLLIEAMRFVMHHYPARQTTHRKIDLMG